MSCRRLKKAGCNDNYGEAKATSYMLVDSAVAKTGGAKRGRKVKGGISMIDDAINAVKGVQNAISGMSSSNTSNTPATTPDNTTGGCGNNNCRRRTKKQGGNVVDLAPFAVALSLIGVRMLKDKQFMNKIDTVVNSPSRVSSGVRSGVRSSRKSQ